MQGKAPLISSWVLRPRKKRGLDWLLQLRKSLKIVHYLICMASFSQCTQREPYNHESSSAQGRNFSDFRMFSSCALCDIMLAGGRSHNKGLRRLGLMRAENALPLGLHLTLKARQVLQKILNTWTLKSGIAHRPGGERGNCHVRTRDRRPLRFITESAYIWRATYVILSQPTY